MTVKTILVTVGTIAILAVQQAGANSVSGGLTMGGSLSLNNASLSAATAITNFGTSPISTVSFGTGTYAALSPYGETVTWSLPVGGLSLLVGPQSIASLWTIAGGYSFDLTYIASDLVTGGDTYLNLLGYGTLFAPGDTPTAGNFTLAFTDADHGAGTTVEFGFSAANSVIPDGGSTACLLGGAVLVLGALRRKVGC